MYSLSKHSRAKCRFDKRATSEVNCGHKIKKGVITSVHCASPTEGENAEPTHLVWLCVFKAPAVLHYTKAIMPFGYSAKQT